MLLKRGWALRNEMKTTRFLNEPANEMKEIKLLYFHKYQNNKVVEDMYQIDLNQKMVRNKFKN